MTLDSLGKNQNFAIFTSSTERLFVDLNNFSLSPTQMGKTFNLKIVPEYYSYFTDTVVSSPLDTKQ